ncbi:MAG TPA: hypothetical protein VK498_08825 [Ferruginibacter sp.]|nr:hypothetical protein [Ferruginibacter sp.]
MTSIMETIRIERTNEYINRWRDYEIYIDGKKIGTISNGETKDFDLAVGEHTLFCKVDWAGSTRITFNIGINEIKTFKVAGFKYAKWIMPVAFLISLLLFFPNFLGSNYKYVLWMLTPVALLLIYYATIARSKYLTLTEGKIESK